MAESFKPPSSVSKQAQKPIDWKKEYGDEVKGGTQVGWTRANQLAKGENISFDTLKRMSSFFARHDGNQSIKPEYKNTPWKDAGYVSWLLWGGDSGKSWAKSIIDKKEENRMSLFFNMDYKAKDYIDTISEASFKSGSSSKVINLLLRYLEKETSIKWFLGDKPDNYSNNYGDFSGYLCIGSNNTAFRLNFNLGKSDRIVSVDYYDTIQKLPSFTIEFDINDNIIQIANRLVSIVSGDPIEERKAFASDVFDTWIQDNPDYNENLLTTERLSVVYDSYFTNWAYDNNQKEISKPSFLNMAKAYLNDNKLNNPYSKAGVIKKSSSEKSIIDKKDDDQFNNAISLSVADKFEQVESFVALVSNSHANGFIITGNPGIGKSHTVLEKLKDMGLSYEYSSGAVKTAKDLYKYLYFHKDEEIIILDDIDSVLLNKTSQNLLKAILDTNTKKRNIVSYLDKDFKSPEEISNMGPKMKQKAIPNSFEFTSGIIFISNLPMGKIDPAIKSRSLIVDLNLNNEEVLERLESKLDKFPPDVENNFKLDGLNFLKKYSSKIKRIDFRMFDKIVTLRLTNHPNWEKWAYVMIMS